MTQLLAKSKPLLYVAYPVPDLVTEVWEKLWDARFPGGTSPTFGEIRKAIIEAHQDSAEWFAAVWWLLNELNAPKDAEP